MKRLLLLAAIALTACERDIYTVTMEATDTGFDRRVAVVRERSNGAQAPPPDELLGPIAALYGHGERPSRDAFAASFADATPADIGGRGALARAETSMGTSLVYIERFRGQDDLSSRIARVQEAAAAIADLFLGWLDTVFETEPAYPAFRETLAGGVLERDLRNIALTVWFERNGGRMAAPGPAERLENNLFVRLTAYLHEHGYVTTDDLARVMSIATDDDAAAALLRAWLARSMGLDVQAPPPSFAPIESAASAGASWGGYLLQSEAARERLALWADGAGLPAGTGDVRSGETATDEVFGYLLVVATGADPAGAESEDEVTLTLACPVRPIQTNGEWSSDHREITWTLTIEPTPGDAYLVPAVAYAAWAEPDKRFQVEHFGYLVLVDEPLAKYCAWRARLGPEEGDRWDRVLASCTNRGQAISVLQSFRPGADPAWSAEQTGLTLMLDALRPTPD
ncbi:MAG TPA: hypothetical protein VFF69_04985 [Phycisphaerales bacterium]|nr:hypothetical protein [Phycisphaerales bacterium]